MRKESTYSKPKVTWNYSGNAAHVTYIKVQK